MCTTPGVPGVCPARTVAVHAPPPGCTVTAACPMPPVPSGVTWSWTPFRPGMSSVLVSGAGAGTDTAAEVEAAGGWCEPPGSDVSSTSPLPRVPGGTISMGPAGA
ncbi:hypothetical protein GA0115257_109153 [Streptomyces sp. LcepLS]|nr:hypothetical protein GA0115257_109153 [Streptomyces sp. LcepLS]